MTVRACVQVLSSYVVASFEQLTLELFSSCGKLLACLMLVPAPWLSFPGQIEHLPVHEQEVHNTAIDLTF